MKLHKVRHFIQQETAYIVSHTKENLCVARLKCLQRVRLQKKNNMPTCVILKKKNEIYICAYASPILLLVFDLYVSVDPRSVGRPTKSGLRGRVEEWAVRGGDQKQRHPFNLYLVYGCAAIRYGRLRSYMASMFALVYFVQQLLLEQLRNRHVTLVILDQTDFVIALRKKKEPKQ